MIVGLGVETSSTLHKTGGQTMKVHNPTNNLLLVNERYMLPGEVRDVPETVVERAKNAHGGKLRIIGREPRVEAVRVPQAQPARADWTEIKGIGPKLADSLYFMGINTKGDLLAWVVMNGESAINDIPGMSDKKTKDLIAWCETD